MTEKSPDSNTKPKIDKNEEVPELEEVENEYDTNRTKTNLDFMAMFGLGGHVYNHKNEKKSCRCSRCRDLSQLEITLKADCLATESTSKNRKKKEEEKEDRKVKTIVSEDMRISVLNRYIIRTGFVKMGCRLYLEGFDLELDGSLKVRELMNKYRDKKFFFK